MKLSIPDFVIDRNESRCTKCRRCIIECANGVFKYDENKKNISYDEDKCVNCLRCVITCPAHALRVYKNPVQYTDNANWSSKTIKEIQKQAQSGGVLLTSNGNPEDYPVYFDKIVVNASQVTNPPIDPLREPMEVKTFLGRKPSKIEIDKTGRLSSKIPPQLELELPIMFAAMSFGSISINACKALAEAASECGTYFNTGEGGFNEELSDYKDRTIVQVASGRFGVDPDYLNLGAAIEIKIGQGAKPGIGGHLSGEKVNEEVSKTRMIPMHSDAISPAPHHDIYSIEDLKQLIFVLKEATDYKKPVIVKVAAVNNIAAIASGIARAGGDIIAIDGFRGGTGAAPLRIRDNVGIPIETAIAAVDTRLKDEGIRNTVSLVASGSIRCSSDIIKAIALGADAVYIGTTALIAIGCHLCHRCCTGKCSWGIATQNPDLVKRLDVEEAKEHLVNLLDAWKNEIKEMIGGMGINSLDSLKGNRQMLRGISLSDRELNILGIKAAGE